MCRSIEFERGGGPQPPDEVSVAIGKVVRGNGGIGIATGARCNLTSNAVTDNVSDGIRVQNGSTVGGNAIEGNALGTLSGTPLVEVGSNLCDTNTTCP